MGRWAALALLLPLSLAAGTAADVARALREASFDRGECYRVRDLSLVKEDIRIYLTDGHLIFSKPVAGHRIAAVFMADTEGGDGEVIVFPPDRAERRSLAAFTHSPNLDDHFRSALFLFTGAEYDDLLSQIARGPEGGSGNKKMPEIGALMDEQWTPVLRKIAGSYETRLALDLVGGGTRPPDLFTAIFDSPKLGTYDLIYDPRNPEQMIGGQITSRDNRNYFDDWFSFTARSLRKNPTPFAEDLATSDYRIEATINADLSMSVVTRVKVRAQEDGMAAASFDITPAMDITSVTVDGRAAEALQPESLRSAAIRSGNKMFLVMPAEPLRAGRDYEFEFHHAGTVIVDAGDRVFYVAARGNWYPIHGMQFASYDLTFKYPHDLDLVAPGDVVDERAEGDSRVVHRRVANTIRMAGFNLGDYAHAREVRGGYTIDVCANRALEAALQPAATMPTVNIQPHRGTPPQPGTNVNPVPVNPLGRLQTLAGDVASALEFMAAKFGPPALPHLAVSPIPGTFGQGFPGLIYLSTLAYLKDRPNGRMATPSLDLYFDDVLEAHETAHQWWGNRVTTENYRDSWLMEALANYSALLYLEKRKGPRAVDQMLDEYRSALLAKDKEGETVESAGPIVLGARLQSSLQPAGWRAITYGKGSWILHMLRYRMGDQRFLAMLSDIVKRYDHANITTELFRKSAAQFLPPKSDDPALEGFFDQWVYGTGIPTLKLTYALKGQAPAVRLVGTLTQSGVDDEFSALTPVEIQVAHGQSITRWVASSNQPVTFTVALKQAPLKVALDPHNAVLRR